MKASYVWGSFVSVSAVTFVLADSARVGIAVGAFAAAGMWFALSRVAARLRAELQPFVTASEPEAMVEELRHHLAERPAAHA